MTRRRSRLRRPPSPPSKSASRPAGPSRGASLASEKAVGPHPPRPRSNARKSRLAMTDRQSRAAARSSLAIDNLRAVVILLVLAFHSVLPYLSSLPRNPFPFDSPPFFWRSFPIVDSVRWLGFDLFCAWLDVFLMSFFFLLSGLFAWPSLSRKGARAFLLDRARRLGVPFAIVVLLLMPLSHYPAYLQTATDPGIAAFWRHWLALVFGPWAWMQPGPFSFQLSRPLHYALYFFAGVAIGACGIERGLIAPGGALARRWAWWLLAAPLLFAAWLGLTAATMDHPEAASLALLALDALSFALACFTSCFFALAVAVRFARTRWTLLDSLKANAYGMYLIHYGVVVWLQYALLGIAWPAIPKAAMVFAGAVLVSWSASAGLRRVRPIAEILGAARDAPAQLPPAAGLAD